MQRKLTHLHQSILSKNFLLRPFKWITWGRRSMFTNSTSHAISGKHPPLTCPSDLDSGITPLDGGDDVTHNEANVPLTHNEAFGYREAVQGSLRENSESREDRSQPNSGFSSRITSEISHSSKGALNFSNYSHDELITRNNEKEPINKPGHNEFIRIQMESDSKALSNPKSEAPLENMSMEKDPEFIEGPNGPIKFIELIKSQQQNEIKFSTGEENNHI